MIANGTHHSNGIPITPADTQRPRWRDAFPRFTHNLSWQDADGCTHSMTLRADDLQDLLGDRRLIKQGIKIAKAKASETASDSDVPPCPVHGTPMIRKQSKRTGGIYFSHKMANGELCFGRPAKA